MPGGRLTQMAFRGTPFSANLSVKAMSPRGPSETAPEKLWMDEATPGALVLLGAMSGSVGAGRWSDAAETGIREETVVLEPRARAEIRPQPVVAGDHRSACGVNGEGQRWLRISIPGSQLPWTPDPLFRINRR